MILWRKRLDPFVKPLETTSSHFNVVLFKPPMNTQSIHVCIYLPTAGLDQEFLEELSALENTIEELKENYPGTPIYVRGDANAALPIRDSNKRDAVFSCFCKRLSLKHTSILHPTYHHFQGDGKSDSQIDVLLQFLPDKTKDESLLEILCCKTNPFIDSDHDAIISSFPAPKSVQPDTSSNSLEDIQVSHKRSKVKWSEDGIYNYRKLLESTLPDLRDGYNHKLSTSSFSALLQVTNSVLDSAATSSNICLTYQINQPTFL